MDLQDGPQQVDPNKMDLEQLTEYLATHLELDAFWAENMAFAWHESNEDWLSYFALTPEVFASLNNQGASALQGRRYEEAGTFFWILTCLTGGRSADGWHGLGLVGQRTLNLETAAIAHSEAFVRDNSHLDAGLAWAECLMLLGRQQEGQRVLQLLVETGKAYLATLAEQAAQNKKGAATSRTQSLEQVMRAKQDVVARAQGLLA